VVALKWSELGLAGKQRLRDLWRCTDLDAVDEKYEATVPRHGVMLLRVSPGDAPKKP
jgi:alpha-galactosidase